VSAAALRRRADTKRRSRWPYDRSTEVTKSGFVSLRKCLSQREFCAVLRAPECRRWLPGRRFYFLRADRGLADTTNVPPAPAGAFSVTHAQERPCTVNPRAASVSGIDLQAGYKLNLSAPRGSLAFTMNGAYLLKTTTTPLPGAHTYDCAGLFGATCQTINPRWHHIFRTTWLTPWDVTASLSWRYIGRVGLDNNDSDPTLHYASFGAYDYFSSHLPSISYLGLGATWNVWKSLELRDRHQQRARQGSAARNFRDHCRRRCEYLLNLRPARAAYSWPSR
jgi:hypothetical protein